MGKEVELGPRCPRTADDPRPLAARVLRQAHLCFGQTQRDSLCLSVPSRQRLTLLVLQVELVDVFPTVVSIGGLPPPADVDGVDVSSLLAPSLSSVAPATAGATAAATTPDLSVAYHQYPACGCSDTPAVCYNRTRAGCNNTPKNKLNFMGYTMRTAQWRYTAWFRWNNKTLTPDWDGDSAEELYNHSGDHSFEMDNYENVNEAAANPGVASKLRAQMRAFFSKDQLPLLVAADDDDTGAGPVPDNSDPYDLLE